MKISNSSKLPKRGYAALLTTLTLSLTIMAFAMSAFRETKQAHQVQSINQVKLDYSQKERAFLRALLDIVPNKVMGGMMPNARTGATINNFAWSQIFTDALARAQADQALDPALRGALGISVDVISANTGDSTFLPNGLVADPTESGHFVFNDVEGGRPSDIALPPRMVFEGGGIGSGGRRRTHPIISLNKRMRSESDFFTEMPYPDISFGYAEQGSNFIAKRNWWAFTLNFGANTAATTGIAPSPRTYLLSIYEVPSQLAVSSSGATTSLGEFDGGQSWDPSNISISGNIYADRARIEDLSQVGSVASRKGVELSASAPSGQMIGGLKERRELRATAASATSTTFYPYSSSSDSGLVSFTPINRGQDFFDFFAGETDQGLPNKNDPRNTDTVSTRVRRRIGPTGWDHYSIGATQTAMRVDVSLVVANNNQIPTRLNIHAKMDNGTDTSQQRCTVGAFWNSPGQPADGPDGDWLLSPAGDDWFLQTQILPNGRPCLALDLEKLPGFLAQIGMDDVTINNSLWIGPNYITTQSDSNGVPPRQASFPSVDTDMALLITKSTDLSAYTNGLTIVTPLRVYFADNFNNVPATPPAGSGITGDWFPPISIYAPEKRFGIQNTSGIIDLSGQIGYLPTDTASADPDDPDNDLHPLDLKDGGTDSVSTANIRATLNEIQRVEDLPPINSMSWLTVIEEIR
jgi:hypothetical protein